VAAITHVYFGGIDTIENISRDEEEWEAEGWIQIKK
jgi:hypothetical protein